ncbi:MAG: MFS transporter [Candidatus Odinarchaeia archaeon]
MKKILKNLTASMLVRTIFGYSVYNFVLLTLTLIDVFKITAVGIGAIMAAYWIPAFMFPLIIGKVADKIGEKSLVLSGTFVLSLASLVIGLASSFEYIVIGRFLTGLGAILFWTPGINLTSKICEDNKLSYYTSLIVLSYGIGTLFAMVFVPIQEFTFGWRSVFLFTAGYGLVVTLIVKLISHDTANPIKKDEKIIKILKNSNLIKVALTQSISIGVWASFLTFFSTYLVLNKGLSFEVSSLTLVIASISGIIFALLGGYFSDKKFKKNQWLSFPLLLLAVIFLLMDFIVGLDTFIDLLIPCIVGALIWIPQGSIWALPRMIEPEQSNLAMGLLVMATGITGFSFPILFGLLVDITGGYVLSYLLLGLVLLITSGISYTLRIRKDWYIKENNGENEDF